MNVVFCLLELFIAMYFFLVAASIKTGPAQNPSKPPHVLIKRADRVGCRVWKLKKVKYIRGPMVGCGS